MSEALPAVVQVGHFRVAIKAGVPRVANEMGWFDSDTLTIHYKEGLPPALLADVVLHEAIHAIFFAYGIPKKLKEERVALSLSGPILILLRDNPKLVEWLLESIKQ